MSVVQIGGMWWPRDDRRARPVILRDVESSIRGLLGHFKGRDLIVQAGGNVGCYPLALADHFRQVVTAEPDPVNFDCLRRNLAARDSLGRVQAHNAALGETAGFCEPVEVEAGNCGAHRVDYGGGAVPVMTIDDLDLKRCDCLFLDIEGPELLALKGAARTIVNFSPVISIEDKGLSRTYGVPIGAAQEWLAGFGYEEVGEYGRDKIFRRSA